MIRTQRDCPGKGFPQGGQIHEGKLELDGAVEIIEEVAPAVEDGRVVPDTEGIVRVGMELVDGNAVDAAYRFRGFARDNAWLLS